MKAQALFSLFLWALCPPPPSAAIEVPRNARPPVEGPTALPALGPQETLSPPPGADLRLEAGIQLLPAETQGLPPVPAAVLPTLTISAPSVLSLPEITPGLPPSGEQVREREAAPISRAGAPGPGEETNGAGEQGESGPPLNALKGRVRADYSSDPLPRAMEADVQTGIGDFDGGGRARKTDRPVLALERIPAPPELAPAPAAPPGESAQPAPTKTGPEDSLPGEVRPGEELSSRFNLVPPSFGNYYRSLLAKGWHPVISFFRAAYMRGEDFFSWLFDPSSGGSPQPRDEEEELARDNLRETGPGQTFILHAPRPAAFRSAGYRLGFEPGPGIGAAQEKDPPILARVRRGNPASPELKRRFEVFNGLIRDNFSALQLLSRHSRAMPVKAARTLLAKTVAMAKAYALLAQDTSLLGETNILGEVLERDLAGLPDNERIQRPQTLARILPLKGYSLHRLINTIHQRALNQVGKVEGSFPTNLLLEVDDGEKMEAMSLVDVSEKPLFSGGRILSKALAALAGSLIGIKDPPRGAVFLQDDQFWAHFKLGAHSAEVYARLANANEGGMIRIRYEEWDKGIANQSRLYYIARLLQELGFAVGIEKGFLTAAVDKDHRSQTPDQMAETVSLIVRILHATVGVDFALPRILRGSTSTPESARRIDDWAAAALAEGNLPFFRHDDDWAMARGWGAYLSGDGERGSLRRALDATLGALGLAKLPEGRLGQRTIDRFFTGRIEEALARGELSSGLDGRPRRDPRYDPLSFADRAVESPAAAARTADVLGSLDPEILEFEPLGTAGRLRAERAQLPLDSGRWLVVYRLTDPRTSQPAFAFAQLADLAAVPIPLGADEILPLLGSQGYSVAEFAPDEDPPGLAERLKSLRSAPETDAADRSRFTGLPLSPGDGRPVLARVTFDRGRAAQGGRIFAADYTTPEDLEAIRNSRAVLVRFGGRLSHASITTREEGIPSVLLAQGSRTGGELVLETVDLSLPLRSRGKIWLRRAQGRKTITVREGDPVRLDPEAGSVELPSPALQSLLLRLAAEPAGPGLGDRLLAELGPAGTEAAWMQAAREILGHFSGAATPDPVSVADLRLARAVLRRSRPDREEALALEEARILAQAAKMETRTLRETREMLSAAETPAAIDRIEGAALARLERLKALARGLDRPLGGSSAVEKAFAAAQRLAGARRAGLSAPAQAGPHLPALAPDPGPIFPLSHPSAADPARSGGKGANLARLRRAAQAAGASTAPGIVLGAQAYRDFIENAGIAGRISEIAASEMERGEKARAIRTLILAAPLSPEGGLGQALLKELGRERLRGLALAVRSSALDEDGQDAAFAGAGTTKLYVREEDLLQSVKEVWASLWNEHALLYREGRGSDLSGLAQAVVIQAMVPAEVSGIAYTEEPVTGHPGRTVVNASFGLGEGTVSGLVSPDEFILDKRTGKEAAAPLVSDKLLQIVPAADGRGVAESPVPGRLRRARSLNPRQLELLNRVCAALEREFGRALDVEFAFVGEKLYILQARPITTRISSNR